MSSDTMYTSSKRSYEMGRRMSLGGVVMGWVGVGGWVGWGGCAAPDADDILVLEVLQDLDLSQRALRVGEVLEGLVDLLDRHLLARRVVHGAAHHAVRPVADGLE